MATNSENSDTVTELVFGDKKYILVGTAHVSAESVREVAAKIDEYKPEKVCIELDRARFASLTQEDSWKNLDIYRILKDGKGFLVLANLVLSGFQKRMGLDSGTKPGEEMREAIRICDEKGIPYALVDRDIQITLRRAWGKSSLWGKNKLLAALLGSAFSNEKLGAEQVEELKQKSALQGMMDELADYLPSVKTVLIDERDQYLATGLFEQPEKTVLAVVGAGHVPGMTKWLGDLHAGTKTNENAGLNLVPKPSKVGKILTWAIPIALLGLVVAAFFSAGWKGGVRELLTWWLVHGTFVALGTILALGHPLTVILGFLASPLGTFHILGSVGLITGSLQAILRKPKVSDLESLQTDIYSLRGFYRNRVTRVLLVFFLSSLGGVIGNLLSITIIWPK